VSATKTPLILSIETATRAGGVTLTRGDHILAVRAGEAAVSHSAHLLYYVSEVLEEGGVALREIELFAVTLGPGSFTGLRIGLATVKSFAATLSRPCVGVPSLHAVARAAGESERALAMLPAGRGEVFAQLLRVDRRGDVHPLDDPSHLTPRRLLDKVRTMRPLTWAGEGAIIHEEAIRAQAQSEGIPFWREGDVGGAESVSAQGWILARPPAILSTAVARLALTRAHSAQVSTPDQLRAIYVRASDAELNERCRE